MYKASDCEYHDYDQRLKEQNIHGLDNEDMIGEILRELTALEDINEITCNQILVWVQKVKVQRVQKEVLDNIREAKKSDSDEISKNSTIIGRIRKR